MVNSSCITLCSLLVNWGTTWISSYVFDRDHRVHLFMCLGIIISTGIYLSVAIYFYLKRNPRFIHCCGGISIYGALLAGVISMIGMVDGSLWVFLPISIPLTIYFLYWVEWIKKHISIRKVCRMTVLTLVISVIIPVSCVYIFLF